MDVTWIAAMLLSVVPMPLHKAPKPAPTPHLAPPRPAARPMVQIEFEYDMAWTEGDFVREIEGGRIEPLCDYQWYVVYRRTGPGFQMIGTVRVGKFMNSYPVEDYYDPDRVLPDDDEIIYEDGDVVWIKRPEGEWHCEYHALRLFGNERKRCKGLTKAGEMLIQSVQRRFNKRRPQR